MLLTYYFDCTRFAHFFVHYVRATLVHLSNNHPSKSEGKNSIHKALYQSNLEDFLIGKYNWAKETFANIDWKSMESSLNGTQGLAKTTIIKMMHRWQPTNSYVQRNDRRPVSDAKCHVCDQTDDQWHYLSCKSTHFTEARAHAW